MSDTELIAVLSDIERQLRRIADNLCHVSEKEDSEEESNQLTYQWLVDTWNELEPYGIAPIKGIAKGSMRAKYVKARMREFGKENIVLAIENVKQSDFLLGRTNYNSSFFNFDWFIRPTNFVKVLDGNYNSKADNKEWYMT